MRSLRYQHATKFEITILVLPCTKVDRLICVLMTGVEENCPLALRTEMDLYRRLAIKALWHL